MFRFPSYSVYSRSKIQCHANPVEYNMFEAIVTIIFPSIIMVIFYEHPRFYIDNRGCVCYFYIILDLQLSPLITVDPAGKLLSRK